MIVSTATMAITGCVPGTLQLLAHVVQHVYYSMYDFQFANTMTDGEKKQFVESYDRSERSKIGLRHFLAGGFQPRVPDSRTWGLCFT